MQIAPRYKGLPCELRGAGDTGWRPRAPGAREIRKLLANLEPGVA